jgi:hypothetical protein
MQGPSCIYYSAALSLHCSNVTPSLWISSNLFCPGFLGSLRYEVLDNPNILVEIADWASAEVRAAAMQQAMSDGVYAPLEELLAAPFRATVIRQLP